MSSNETHSSGRRRTLPQEDLMQDDDLPAQQRRRMNGGGSQAIRRNENSTHNGEKEKEKEEKVDGNRVNESQLFRFLEIPHMDDFENKLMVWVRSQMESKSHANIEIECKLGLLLKAGALRQLTLENKKIWMIDERERRSLRKFSEIGIECASIINVDVSPASFHSQVSSNVFKHLNRVLNNWVTNAHCPAEKRIAPLQQMQYPKVKFVRTKLIDKIYSNKVRVSLAIDRPNHVSKCIKKDRLSDLNIMYPRSGFDLRVSASLENVCPRPENSVGLETIRCKDRIGYQWDIFTIDISTIHSYKEDLNDAQFVETLRQSMSKSKQLPYDHGLELSHEIEIEITDSKLLGKKVQELQNASQQKPMTRPTFHEIMFTFKNHCLQLADVASRVGSLPFVCRLPQQAKK